MSAGLFKAPTSNFSSTSLNGAINDSVDTFTLNSVTGLQSPGYLVIDRQDSNGNDTPTLREEISYTGISGSDLTGVTRGDDSSTARSHSDGALVEPVLTVGMWNDQRDAINAEHDTDGTHTIISSATITTANINSGFISSATITTANIGTLVNYDGWISANETWTYASATTITVPSGAAAKYAKGDKIKLTQTTVKYFYVTSIADTVLTVTGGTDYTVANAAITANYYSHATSPIGFPSYFNYTCVFSGTGVDAGNLTQTSYFSINGRTVHAIIGISFGSTTNFGSGTFSFSLPVTNEAVVAGQVIGIAHMRDAGTSREIGAPVDNSSTGFNIYEYGSATEIDYQNPWTWASTDNVLADLTYKLN